VAELSALEACATCRRDAEGECHELESAGLGRREHDVVDVGARKQELIRGLVATFEDEKD